MADDASVPAAPRRRHNGHHVAPPLRPLRPDHRFAHARVLVQRAEVGAAREPLYTVPEWAFPQGVELTEIDGDHQVAPGIEIIATPGHTVGHQSVLIDDGNGQRIIACCQGSWNAESFNATELGDDGWDRAVGAESMRRLHSLQPTSVLFSHDSRPWSPGESVGPALDEPSE